MCDVSTLDSDWSTLIEKKGHEKFEKRLQTPEELVRLEDARHGLLKKLGESAHIILKSPRSFHSSGPAINLQLEADLIINDRQIDVSSSIDGSGKYDNIDLQLPSLAPPRHLQPRQLIMRRKSVSSFGFSLQECEIIERVKGTSSLKRKVIFIENDSCDENVCMGLLPGDCLIDVNGVDVSKMTVGQVWQVIKNLSGKEIKLSVQPLSELSELSVRSAPDGSDVAIQSVHTGTLKRSGSLLYDFNQVTIKL